MLINEYNLHKKLKLDSKIPLGSLYRPDYPAREGKN